MIARGRREAKGAVNGYYSPSGITHDVPSLVVVVSLVLYDYDIMQVCVIDRDAIGERKQRINEQQARLRLTRANQKAENSASIAKLRARRSETMSLEEQKQLDLEIFETRRKEKLQRELLIRQNAIVNRQLDGLNRAARTFARIRPISSALRANPEAIKSLLTAQRILRPLQNALVALADTAKENAIRDQFREVADEAVRVQRLFGRFQRDQSKFVSATEDRLVKLRNTLAKVQADEEKIRGRVLEGDRAVAARILKAVDDALRTGAKRVDQAFRDAFKIDPDNLEKARKIFIQILDIRRKAARTAEEIKQVEEARRVGLELLNQGFEKRLANLAAELALEKSISLEKAKQALALAKISARGDLARGTPTEKRIAGLRAEAEATRFQIGIEDDASRRRVEAIRQAQQEAGISEEAFQSLGAAIVSEAQRSQAEIARMNIELDKTSAALGRIGEGGILDGLRFGFEEALDSIDAFQSAVQVANELISEISGALADAILEPAEAGKRIEQFFRNLVKTILTEFIKLAIIKPLLEAIGLAGNITATIDAAQLLTAATALGAAGLILDGAAAALLEAAIALALAGAVSGGAGVAEGGHIRSGGRPSSAHRFARGLAGGGRPPGLDPRDTVPLWGQVGEFMMKLRAVQSYGLNTMNAINEGLVDPMQLRALAGTASYRKGSLGLALGGEVARGRGRGGDVTAVVINSEKVTNDGYNDHLARQQHALGRLPRTVADTRRRR